MLRNKGFIKNIFRDAVKSFDPAASRNFSSINRKMTEDKASDIEAEYRHGLSYWRMIERNDGTVYLLPSNK